MSEEQILIVTAIAISFLHTLAGPDHYLPFIALSKAKGWSLGRTIFWTLICGCGHVWSSVFLALGGAALGWSLSKISWLESVRGGLAGWVLLGFGALYFIWGLFRAANGRRHKHFDISNDGDVYVFEHRHGQAVPSSERHVVTPWVMFIVFLLGPCEPMIPLLYFPAAKNSPGMLLLLIVVYTIFTLLTMCTMVLIGYFGIAFCKTEKLERYMHALGGFAIFSCGIGMVLMGW